MFHRMDTEMMRWPDESFCLCLDSDLCAADGFWVPLEHSCCFWTCVRRFAFLRVACLVANFRALMVWILAICWRRKRDRQCVVHPTGLDKFAPNGVCDCNTIIL